MKSAEMAKKTRDLLKTLPAEADWEDLMYRIYVRKKIDAGLRDSQHGRVYASDEVRKSLRLTS